MTSNNVLRQMGFPNPLRSRRMWLQVCVDTKLSIFSQVSTLLHLGLRWQVLVLVINLVFYFTAGPKTIQHRQYLLRHLEDCRAWDLPYILFVQLQQQNLNACSNH